MKIAASILACDFSNIGNEVKAVSKSGADLIHLDIMDGTFVPNISFGPAVVSSAKKYSNLPFDVHLMINKPHKYIEQFAMSGSDIITFHVESNTNIDNTIEMIKKYNVKPGLVIKPNTPAKSIIPYINRLYMVLVMSVEPGFGGQKFMNDMMDKVREIKSESKKLNPNLLIEVDGGINFETIVEASKAEVDICVAGTSIFNSLDYKEAIEHLKKVANNSLKNE